MNTFGSLAICLEDDEIAVRPSLARPQVVLTLAKSDSPNVEGYFSVAGATALRDALTRSLNVIAKREADELAGAS